VEANTTAALPPRAEKPRITARLLPAASSTALTSSITSWSDGSPQMWSEAPAPRGSNTIRREKDASFRRKRA
jgi:hypothetical protein